MESERDELPIGCGNSGQLADPPAEPANRAIASLRKRGYERTT
jgi:hypothetical protein